MERIAAFLLEMNRRISTAPTVALPMARQDIGDYLGLTLETVYRAFSNLQERGVLKVVGARQIQILNLKKIAHAWRMTTAGLWQRCQVEVRPSRKETLVMLVLGAMTQRSASHRTCGLQKYVRFARWIQSVGATL